MMVFIGNRKLHVSAYSGHYQGFDNFLAIRVVYNMHKPRVDVYNSYSKKNCQNLMMAAIGRNM